MKSQSLIRKNGLMSITMKWCEKKRKSNEEFFDFMQSMGIDIDLGDLDFDDPESLGKIHERLHQAKVDI